MTTSCSWVAVLACCAMLTPWLCLILGPGISTTAAWLIQLLLTASAWTAWLLHLDPVAPHSLQLITCLGALIYIFLILAIFISIKIKNPINDLLSLRAEEDMQSDSKK